MFKDVRPPDQVALARVLEQRRSDEAIEAEWRRRIKLNELQREVDRRRLANMR